MDHGHKHSPVYFIRLLQGSVRLTDTGTLRRHEVLPLQKLDRTRHSLCDPWALLMQYPGGGVPMSKLKCRLQTLCQTLRENLGWHLQPQPWPQEIIISPKPLISAAKEPGACSLFQWEGRALFYLFPQPLGPAPLSNTYPYKITASCKGSPVRGFLEQLAGPALKEREPRKEPRINPLNADAFLFIQ